MPVMEDSEMKEDNKDEEDANTTDCNKDEEDANTTDCNKDEEDANTTDCNETVVKMNYGEENERDNDNKIENKLSAKDDQSEVELKEVVKETPDMVVDNNNERMVREMSPRSGAGTERDEDEKNYSDSADDDDFGPTLDMMG